MKHASTSTQGSVGLFAAALALVLCLVGCAGTPMAGEAPALALRYLGGATLARTPDGVLRDFGGISGLDRDAATGTWYLLSDDRSARAPVRFYTAAIELDATGIHGIRVTGAVPLRQPDGSVFPSLSQGGAAPDPEALRIDPVDGELVWSSEGDRKRGLQPFVRRAARDGRFITELPLPHNLRVHPEAERGVRDNRAFEGLAFAPDGASLWVAMEAPLYEDGPEPTLQRGGPVRFTRLDRQGRVLGQYAYPVDAIPRPGIGGRQRADNGVSEILSTDDGALLVVERAGREVEEGGFEFTIRLFEARVDGATDVARAQA